ncbi:MAG: hypothetical protein HFI86_07175 [Bacilli bacterium]|nr:hypothetical protein [Bacilli bacterium]MCI9435030.1 hypothetical protein [Bacilli bacterium]
MKQDKYTKKEIEVLDIQIIATIFFIISLIISIILTYDEKLKLINGQGIFKNKQAQQIALFNRILVVILALAFVYGNYITEKIAEARNKNNVKYLKLQLFSGELSLIGALIVLYIVYKNQGNENFGVADTENPIL